MRLLTEKEVTEKIKDFNKLRSHNYIARFPEDIDARIDEFLAKTKGKLYSCLAGEIRKGDWYVNIEGSSLGQWSPDTYLYFGVQPEDVEWIKEELEKLKPKGDCYYGYSVRKGQLTI